MLKLAAIRRRLRDERGVTLMEALVALATSVVVIGALFTILEVSLTQSVRLSDVAQANQLGRTTMNHIVDELHSTCLAQGFAPVQEKSSEDEPIFVDGYGEGAEVANVGTGATGVREDKIVWSPTAETLTDYTYYATGGSASAGYTFASSASPAAGTRIGEHISQLVEGGAKAPIFKYYDYKTTAGTSTTAASSQLNETTLTPEGKTLSAATAESVASVVVSFQSAPIDNRGSLGRSAGLTSQATFAFSAPSVEAASADGPCE